jgi:hypothetical protein
MKTAEMDYYRQYSYNLGCLVNADVQITGMQS